MMTFPVWAQSVATSESETAVVITLDNAEKTGVDTLILNNPINGLGTNDDQQDRKLSIFPNPFIDEINIQHTDSLITEISIADISGNVIKTEACTNCTHGKIRTGALKTGPYILIITDQKGTTYHKVFKN